MKTGIRNNESICVRGGLPRAWAGGLSLWTWVLWPLASLQNLALGSYHLGSFLYPLMELLQTKPGPPGTLNRDSRHSGSLPCWPSPFKEFKRR